ncbi:MAG: hypothetical protein Q9195_009186 [Heterodermia aff. obscurata]
MSVPSVGGVIAEQITLLEHYYLGCSHGLGFRSREFLIVITLYKIFESSWKSAPAIDDQTLRRLDAILCAEFKELDVKDVAGHLQYYTELRTQMPNKFSRLKDLDIALTEGFRQREMETAIERKVGSGVSNERKNLG